MKKVGLIILIALLVLSTSTLATVSASAASSNDKVQYKPAHGGYVLTTVVDDVDNPKPLGVRFSGFYFGDSDITVTADIYSSDGFVIDFYINEQDSLLTAAQAARKRAIIDLAEAINDFINEVDAAANTQYNGVVFDVESDIFKYNSALCGSKLEISKHTYEMLQIAREMYLATDGAFNPAVYRLVDLWGFSSRIFAKGNFGLSYDRPISGSEFAANGYPLPDDKYVQAFSAPAFTDFSDNAVTLSQENGKYFVTKNVQPAVVDGVSFEQWLDLGGIAKGYAVDGIREMIAGKGIERFNVDAGSSSMAFGKNYDGGDNVINLPDPFDPSSVIYPQGANMVSLTIGSCSVSTSGQYLRKYVTNGIEYSHIIDGVTGKPAQTGIKLVTIVAPEGGYWAGKGDCLTTALTVMGLDKVAEFMNGYLKDNGIEVVMLCKTESGSKQIVSSISQQDLKKLNDNYDEFAWATKLDQNGNYVYLPDADVRHNGNYTWLIIALAVLTGLSAVAAVVYHILKGRSKTAQNVLNAKRDKPFKLGDLGVYLAVVLLVAVLFVVFLSDDDTAQLETIKVIDLQNGETLYTYNVKQGKQTFNYDSFNGWTIERVSQDSDGICLKFSREINGERRFNTVLINLDKQVSVEMIDSACGYHQDCVRVFSALTRPNGVIVCSPNRLKIVSLG